MTYVLVPILTLFAALQPVNAPLPIAAVELGSVIADSCVHPLNASEPITNGDDVSPIGIDVSTVPENAPLPITSTSFGYASVISESLVFEKQLAGIKGILLLIFIDFKPEFANAPAPSEMSPAGSSISVIYCNPSNASGSIYLILLLIVISFK